MASTAPTGLGIAVDSAAEPPHHVEQGPSGLHLQGHSSAAFGKNISESADCVAGPSDAVRSAAGVPEPTRGAFGPACEAATEGLTASTSRPSLPSHTSTSSSMNTEAGLSGHFVRSDTLLSFGRSQTRNAAELKALMGNSNSRLKAGATVHVASRRTEQGSDDTQVDAVALEQAKSRSRVEVDIVLDSDTFVQGGFMKGHVKVRVRKRSRKEDHVCLADPKVRVIGFECIPGQSERHTFYQCASPLSTITDGVDRLFDTPTGSDGFARAVEGLHTFPFAMRLPTDSKFGAAKGVLNLHSGVTVQYITMISIKVKDPKTEKRSIAHFYRNCEVWPRLSASILLASAPRPLQATTSKSLAMLSSDRKVKLTAQLHRLTWIAGQRCYISVSVANDTKKIVKTLTLTLVRSTTMFRPSPELDTGRARSVDPDACQTTTLHKVVGETVLEMAQSGTKGRASAKGWWTGVGPGKELSFSHYILIPPEALSVTRSRFLEVEYSIRVTLSAGSLTPDVYVTLPIRVINFLSIDPIPSEPSRSLLAEPVHPLKRRRSIDGELDPVPRASISRTAILRADGLIDADAHDPAIFQQQSNRGSPRSVSDAWTREHSLRLTNPDQVSSTITTSDSDASMYSSDESCQSSMDELASSSETQISRGLGNLDLEDPDSDEEVGFVVGSAPLEYTEDPTIAGPEYGSSRAIVPRPMGPRSGSRAGRDRGRARDVRPIQRRNTINVGALPPREYRNVRDETERRARESFVEGVNERLLAATSLRGLRRRDRHDPADSVHSSDGAITDMDATPRLVQDRSDIPQVSVRPLRPSRNPARRTPAPSGNGTFPTGSQDCAAVGMGTAVDATSVSGSAFSQHSVRRSRALPRRPVNISTASVESGHMASTAPIAPPVGPPIYDGPSTVETFPIARSQQAVSVTGGGGYVPTPSDSGVHCHPPDMQSVFHVDTVSQEHDGTGLRGRTVHAFVGNASRSESSSSASTSSSGYDSGYSYETSMTSVHSVDDGGADVDGGHADGGRVRERRPGAGAHRCQ
ncbi:hypothetical protein EVJ58_g3424 [Rhodofomes roseus]|uniref:Arrestin C-terminal-like domain-containing protein n=1 Tax=Rhodofomes roseus TaxID=34475 RepID=A0A4Y9YN47_9APHY|nr:hypothetical protein EVJ58_g3424 [Rhodofomes roseus]